MNIDKYYVTLINRGIKLRIRKWVADEIPMSEEDLKDFFDYVTYRLDANSEDFTLENIENYAIDYAYEYAESSLSIFNYDIMEDFKRLEYWEIDDIADNSGWIKYNSDISFIDFARAILTQNKVDEIYKAISLVVEEGELIEFDSEDIKEVKNDILNHLENYRDTYIEGLAEIYKTENSLNAVEAINEYITELCYCSWASAGYEGPSRGWDIYQYYYIDLYNDKDIQKAILNY